MRKPQSQQIMATQAQKAALMPIKLQTQSNTLNFKMALTALQTGNTLHPKPPIRSDKYLGWAFTKG